LRGGEVCVESGCLTLRVRRFWVKGRKSWGKRSVLAIFARRHKAESYPTVVNRHSETHSAAVLEPLPTIEETQRLLGGVSRRTVLRELDAGELVRVRVRGRVLVDPDSIRSYIARHREPVS
jgi:hypothetical protein